MTYTGQIQWGAFNFAPQGWALCNGQLLPIAQNQALFSLLGTSYGGNGQTNFALPNLRGRVAVGAGDLYVGQAAGAEYVTLLEANLPTHTHTRGVTAERATTGDPGAATNGKVFASGERAFAAQPNAIFHPSTVSSFGGSQAHPNMQPYTVLTAIICLNGIFPSEN
jgi:microcystin-dependent protein